MAQKMKSKKSKRTKRHEMLIEHACGVYMHDSNASLLGQYSILKQIKKEFKDENLALNYVDVSVDFQYLSVEKLLDLIEAEVNATKSLIKRYNAMK